jgi:hypothetical protein
MFKVPLMALAPPFGFTEKVTVPFPLLFAPEVTCVHPTLLTAVQAQPEGAVTFTLPDPPLDPKEPDDADSEDVQGAPASLAVTVWPAMVSVPLRLLALLLGLAENETVPLPVPVAPAVTDTQPTLLTALQVQPAGAVTFTLADPPV